LLPAIVAAVDLLRDASRLRRLKLCGQCRWLFLDHSRNRSRRWCSMSECGAQVKMRRYRARRRQSPSPPPGA
jgi:predicted RNA-binding Zn ribbon-like protein